MASATHFCNKYLKNSVSTKFLPPLDRVRPHLLCFLNIKFPGLQESVESKGKVSKLLDKKFFFLKNGILLQKKYSHYVRLLFRGINLHELLIACHLLPMALSNINLDV